MKKLKLIALSVVVLWSGLQLQAEFPDKKKIKTSSKIQGVTVYQDRALVLRQTGKQNLEPGVYEITVKDLPATLKNSSVRAESTSLNGVKILDVEVKSYQLSRAPRAKIRALKEKLEILREKKGGINDDLKLHKFQRNFLYSVQKSYLAVSSGDKTTTPARNVQDYDKMLGYLTQKLMNNSLKLRKDKKHLRQINRKIALVRGKMRKLNVSSSALTRKKLVKTTLEVKRRSAFRLDLSYINVNVSWAPGYDIRVSPNKKTAEFTGYGVVAQNSGEDWKNTKLAFSTARPAQQSRVPDLKPLFVSFTGSRRNAGRLDRKVTTSKTSPKGVGSQVFTVPKKSDIPADGSPHRTALSRSSLPVSFEYLTIPALSSHAYLQAVGVNNMKRPILEGDLNIFIENNFVGSSYAGNILPGEKFELTLSVNENIRVGRTLEESKELKPGILSSNRQFKYSYQIKLENFTDKNIVMNALDQIPVSKTRDVQVKDVTFSHQPMVRSKKGILKWRMNMKPGEKVVINLAYTVVVPAKRFVALYRNPKNLSRPGQPKVLSEDSESDKGQRIRRYKKSRAPAMRRQMY